MVNTTSNDTMTTVVAYFTEQTLTQYNTNEFTLDMSSSDFCYYSSIIKENTCLGEMRTHSTLGIYK